METKVLSFFNYFCYITPALIPMPTPILLEMPVVQDNALYHSSDNNVTVDLLWNNSYKINIVKFKSATCLRSWDLLWGSHISVSSASTVLVVFESRTHAILVNDWAWPDPGHFYPIWDSSTILDSQNSVHILGFSYANFFSLSFHGCQACLAVC